MPIYHLRRTATFSESYSLAASSEAEAIEFAFDTTPDIVEDMGDGEWDVIQIEPDPEPEPATEVDPRVAALRARAVDIIDNEADLVRDDDSGDRSAEVKRLLRALYDTDRSAWSRLAWEFPAHDDEVGAETVRDRRAFGDAVAHAVNLLGPDYYTAPESTR